MIFATHLSFNGQCEAAFKFYARVLGGNATMLTYGDSPMAEQVSQEWRVKIVHATLTINDAAVLAGADVLPEQHLQQQGFYVLLSVEDPAKARSIFQALAENGSIRMPIQQTFWSPAFGVLVDQFGVPWMVNCEAPQ